MANVYEKKPNKFVRKGYFANIKERNRRLYNKKRVNLCVKTDKITGGGERANFCNKLGRNKLA